MDFVDILLTALFWVVVGLVLALIFGRIASRFNAKEEEIFSQYREDSYNETHGGKRGTVH